MLGRASGRPTGRTDSRRPAAGGATTTRGRSGRRSPGRWRLEVDAAQVDLYGLLLWLEVHDDDEALAPVVCRAQEGVVLLGSSRRQSLPPARVVHGRVRGLQLQNPALFGIGEDRRPQAVDHLREHDQVTGGGGEGHREMRLARVFELRRIEVEDAADLDDAVVIVAQGALDRARIAALDGVCHDVAALLPEDAEPVVLHARPATFRDPGHRIFVKGASAFRLAVLAAVAGDDVGHAPAVRAPVTADVPVHGIDHHAVDAGVHPEADDLPNLVLELGAPPVVLRQPHRLSGQIDAFPFRPVVLAGALAVLPELVLLGVVVRPACSPANGRAAP